MSPRAMSVAVCLFRDNLRVADNLALWEAASGGRPVLPVFVLDDTAPGRWRLGGAARWWLHHSLGSLARSLERRGSRLALLRGETADVLGGLLAACPAGSLHLQHGHAPWDAGLEGRIRALCDRVGAQFRPCEDRVLFPPGEVRGSQGRPFRVFTPFWRHCLGLGPPAAPVPTPGRLDAPREWPPSLRLEDLDLLPEKAAWTKGLQDSWTPGEKGAQALLREFSARGVGGYATDRDRPDIAGGTSRLSPHIRFGEIGVRTLWHAVAGMREGTETPAPGADAFLRELGWREFSHHLLHHFPDLPGREFRPEFRDFPWREDRAALRAWQRGRTGFPIIDAGMRQLRRTGWMHNRVRMVAASFLTKNLLVDWRAGQDWFWDNLVDADIANNTVSWQWVAGCGADAAPYFRIFNPVLQGRKFDPRGDYVKAFVPELEGVAPDRVHEPWAAGGKGGGLAGPRPGEGYPGPMVSLADTRRRALAAHQGLRKGGRPGPG